MSETTHIAFQSPTEKATFRSSPSAVEGEASKPQFTPSKDEEAAFGASNENPNAFADVHANVLEIDKKKKQVGKKEMRLCDDGTRANSCFRNITV
jgi:hypothetical protein